MSTARILLFALLLTLATTALGFELLGVHRTTTRPGCLPGIPTRDYQYQSRSRSETVLSTTGVLLQLPREPALAPTDIAPTNLVPTNPLPTDLDRAGIVTARSRPEDDRIIKLFQLDRSRLRINHCSISDVALQLDDQGHWVLSLRADQNPLPKGRDPQSRIETRYNPRLHLKRNEFVVRLRCLGFVQESRAEIHAGRPVLAEINPEPFWVENGQPKYLRVTDCADELRWNLHLIDRVEVEFFYR